MLIQESDHVTRKAYRWLSDLIPKREIIESLNLSRNTYLSIMMFFFFWFILKK